MSLETVDGDTLHKLRMIIRNHLFDNRERLRELLDKVDKSVTAVDNGIWVPYRIKDAQRQVDLAETMLDRIDKEIRRRRKCRS